MRPGDGRQTYRWTKSEVMDDFVTDKHCIEQLRGIPEEYIRNYLDEFGGMSVCEVCNTDFNRGFHITCAVAANSVGKGCIDVNKHPVTEYFEFPFSIAVGIRRRFEFDQGTPCRICGEITDGDKYCKRHREQKYRLEKNYRELLNLARKEAELVDIEMLRLETRKEYLKLEKDDV